jgi:hypothetical protein
MSEPSRFAVSAQAMVLGRSLAVALAVVPSLRPVTAAGQKFLSARPCAQWVAKADRKRGSAEG